MIAKGCNACVARVAREGHPGSTVSRRTPAQEKIGMPEKQTLERARSAKQAIAIGLSKARRSGVDLPPPREGKSSERTRKSAARDYARGHGAPARRKSTAKRSRASAQALKREGMSAASHRALAKQARGAARRRTRGERSAAARKAVRTKGPEQRSAAARKAARSREAHASA
jgi:hypothetical protein